MDDITKVLHKGIHDHNTHTSRIDRNVWLLLDKLEKEELSNQELIQRLSIIKEAVVKSRKDIDYIYSEIKKLI